MDGELQARRDLASEYSEKADSYVDYWAPILRKFSQPLLDALPLSSALRILEVGCGPGLLLGELRNGAPEGLVVGVDRAEGMVRTALSKAECPVAVMDAERLGLRDGLFDAALCAFVLFHLSDPRACLREIRRVLAPGGSAGVIVWGEDPGTPGKLVWTEEMDAGGAAPEPRHWSVMQHGLMNTPAKVEGLLWDAGFGAVRTWPERFEQPFSLAELLALNIGCGMPGRRLKSLSPSDREACVGRVTARLSRFATEDLVYRTEVICAVAK